MTLKQWRSNPLSSPHRFENAHRKAGTAIAFTNRVRLLPLLVIGVLPSLLPALSFNSARAQAFPPAVDLAKQLDLLTGTDIRAIRVDARGDVYLAGWRTDPVNDSTVRRIGTGIGNGTGDLIFIKMSSTLDRVYYATLIGGSDTDCSTP